MKKFLIFCSLLIILIVGVVCSQFSLKDLVNNLGEKTILTNNFGFITEEFESSNYIVYKSGNNVVGECVKINASKEKLNQISDKLGLMILKQYTVNGIKMIEGFSAKLKYSLDNKQTNMQIAVKENEIVIGSPIIYGSY